MNKIPFSFSEDSGKSPDYIVLGGPTLSEINHTFEVSAKCTDKKLVSVTFTLCPLGSLTEDVKEVSVVVVGLINKKLGEGPMEVLCYSSEKKGLSGDETIAKYYSILYYTKNNAGAAWIV